MDAIRFTTTPTEAMFVVATTYQISSNNKKCVVMFNCYNYIYNTVIPSNLSTFKEWYVLCACISLHGCMKETITYYSVWRGNKRKIIPLSVERIMIVLSFGEFQYMILIVCAYIVFVIAKLSLIE